MRILIKGGIWKNTEDEILKAAVMKYGKNQWARVASLLNRKSAKQCKSRWYEWLDPSIKKTEWSKEEEEKLLHLAKLMPNQWRTIAPIIGRTAGQCMEHYERLLDQVQQTDGMDESGQDDPRILKPGEIDPAPETKPARPDPIDMDEDEKEMLSEARARLANTQGKKAKRKARERMLDESRRLSMLQKRRELKAAGVQSRLGLNTSNRKYINYAKEIPFQKVPPIGFYDVNGENREANSVKLDPKVQGIELAKLEGRHEREEEERMRAKDKNALKKLFKENTPLAIMKISAENDPISIRKRQSLNLPTPQVTDVELEDIVKMGQQTMSIMGPPEGLPSIATQSLIADYGPVFKPSSTPMRTPVQEDVIMQEARNLRVLREMTPLVESDAELPELYEGTGFGGIKPRMSKLATPNTLLTSYGVRPGSTPAIENYSATPMTGQRLLLKDGTDSSIAANSRFSMHSNQIRDKFGLNEPSNSDNFSISDTANVRTDRTKSVFNRDELLMKLKSLPEPEFIYELSIPKSLVSIEDENEFDEKGMANKAEDAADIQEQLMSQQQERERLELLSRSSVIKRGLPRLSVVHLMSNKRKLKGWMDTLQQSHIILGNEDKPMHKEASKLIHQEMLQLIQSDEYKFPNTNEVHEEDKKRQKLIKPASVELDRIEWEEMQYAKDMILNESGMYSEDMKRVIELGMDDLMKEIESKNKNLLFIPNVKEEGGGHYGVPANKTEFLTALATQLEALKYRIDKDTKKALNKENKLKVLLQGYILRGEALERSLEDAVKELNDSEIDLKKVEFMYKQESDELDLRWQELNQTVQSEERKEHEMQLYYAQLLEFQNQVIHAI